MSLISIAIAPVAIILFYIYLRDKYEKEPLRSLAAALVSGCLITLPVIYTERWLSLPSGNIPAGMASAAYESVVVAGLTEEFFKFLVFMLLFWNNRQFNETFDGIVYATFISLGFALIENIMYVFSQGMGTGMVRAFTAVPAHALFGIIMGYQFGLARFYPAERIRRIIAALLLPVILHGIYDFILISRHDLLLLLFIPYILFLSVFGFGRMKRLSDRSVYRWISGKRTSR